MRVVVVIASSTRGFTTPRAATPTVINPYPRPPDQDEKGSLSRDELEQLLAVGTIPAVKIRLVRNGRAAPDRAWANEGKQALIADGERIRHMVDDGFTLIVSQADKFAPGLFGLCSGLRAELSHRFAANIYLTPPTSQGFITHFDDHDVIVLQLAGEKDWRVYDRWTDAPREPTNVTIPEGQEPIITTRLKQGDSLYIPRGFAHSASCTDQGSLHASVGIYPATLAHLLRHAVEELAMSGVLSEPLQPRFGSDPAELAPLISAASHVLSEQLAKSGRTEELARTFCQSWCNVGQAGPPR